MQHTRTSPCFNPRSACRQAVLHIIRRASRVSSQLSLGVRVNWPWQFSTDRHCHVQTRQCLSTPGQTDISSDLNVTSKRDSISLVHAWSDRHFVKPLAFYRHSAASSTTIANIELITALCTQAFPALHFDITKMSLTSGTKLLALCTGHGRNACGLPAMIFVTDCFYFCVVNF